MTDTEVLMPITDATLTEYVNAALAVDRALTRSERTAFLEFRLVGAYKGAQPADWLADADNTDAFLQHTQPWWEKYGDRFLADLLALHELPEPLTRQLLNYALFATFAIASASTGERRRMHVEIASGAALWVRGYAEALGWSPQH